MYLNTLVGMKKETFKKNINIKEKCHLGKKWVIVQDQIYKLQEI